MNKKFKNLFLAGALVLGLAGVAVSCTDYDDDIQKLQSDIQNVNTNLSTVQQQVTALQNAINAGSVITSVTAISGEPGGWKFTTSDGKSYDVLNGAKGANGAAGKDGVYYTPNPETGCWDLHDGDTVTNTEQSYLPGGVVAYDAEKNVLFVKNGDETIELSLSAGETGIVFIPQCYIDGVEGMIGGILFYNPLELKKDAKIDSKTEEWVSKTTKDANNRVIDVLKQVNLPMEAQYHVNVSDFELDDTFEYAFVVEDVPFYDTRVKSSKDFSIVPTFKSYENGILTVKVTMTGEEAYGDDITRFALQITKDGKTITSDYATLYSEYIEDTKIADPKAVVKECKPAVPNYDEHYRTKIAAADAGDAYLPTQLVWSEGHATLNDAHATCDTAVVYDGSIDLKTITTVHYKLYGVNTWNNDVEMTADMAKKLGLSFVYEVVKNYKIGTPVTDQADFVTLADGVFTPRTYETDGTAAIGRTPIVRVKLMLGEDIVAVAYIKVFISQVDPIGPKFTLLPVDKDGKNIFAFDCNGAKLTTTVPDMNTILYNGTQKSKNEFHALYTDWKVTDQYPIGNVVDVLVSPAEGTHVLEWTVPADSLWKYAGKDIEINGRYYNPTNEANGVYVDVKLTASVADLAKAFNLDPAKGDYITEYWIENYAATKYNVVTPSLTDTLAADAAKCVFKNNINASFVTYPAGHSKAGLLKINDGLTDLKYFFCNPDANVKDEGMVAVKTIGNLNVKFEIKADGTELWAAIMKADKPAEVAVASQLVAKITNNTDGPDWNVFEYQKGTVVADALLNTGKMFVYIGAKATMCSDANKKVAISFNGQNHFQANIIQPVTIATKSKDGFVDAVDFGEVGSYIKIEDLLDPIDWRGRKFSEGPGKLHLGYWNYYGPFDVKIDIASAQCDLNGTRQAVPVTIVLNQTPGAETGTIAVTDPVTGSAVNLPANKGGYLTYKNNGTVVTGDFHIFVKAKVGYGFGYIDTDYIEIPVAKTIGQ